MGTLTTTDRHPFYDVTRAAFVDAAGLKPGDRLQRPGGHTATVLQVRRYQATQTTYDLTINDLHTYYVEAGETPVLVHNCAAGGPKPGWFDRIKGALSGRSAPPEPNATVGDLRRYGHDMVDDSGEWQSDPLKKAIVHARSDDDLLASVLDPERSDGKYGQPITVSEEDQFFVEGNHRAAELMARASDPNNPRIQWDTPIYIKRFGG
ncbi:MAG TPA: polymorphic toxin-type HINT domain-containing protein [Streptosporangiaceae bacterium]